MNDLELSKNFLKQLLDKPTYEKWILPLSFIGTRDNIVFAGSPDKKKTVWIKKNLLIKINKHIKKEFKLTLQLVPLYEDEEEEEEESISNETAAAPTNNNAVKNIRSEVQFFHPNNLNSNYTFQNFVQVDQNRMAYSFAYSVAEFPAKSYNPLYVYSDVGLGKTHLMYAIGNHILQNDNTKKILYSTTSEFMHEYVEYNRLNKRPEFIKKYTSADVLLIDDIQYITKWEGTSEQFYYIFNKLRELEKQIVLCSDKHPDYIPNLEQRIKSRFEWGAIVDIVHYDLEARLAILKNKLNERQFSIKNNFAIPEDVLYYIASSVKDNVRKMEGALNRLIGYANLKYADTTGNQIDLDFAKEALKPIISKEKKVVTIVQIQEYIAKQFNVKKDDLISKSNKRDIAHPRQIAMYIVKKLTKTPLNEIGHTFGGKHHSTVLHSIKKVETNMAKDHEFARKINSYLKFFEE